MLPERIGGKLREHLRETSKNFSLDTKISKLAKKIKTYYRERETNRLAPPPPPQHRRGAAPPLPRPRTPQAAAPRSATETPTFAAARPPRPRRARTHRLHLHTAHALAPRLPRAPPPLRTTATARSPSTPAPVAPSPRAHPWSLAGGRRRSRAGRGVGRPRAYPPPGFGSTTAREPKGAAWAGSTGMEQNGGPGTWEGAREGGNANAPGEED
jgi:hypothetical protein